MGRNSGFTLLEVLVVMVIIGILAGAWAVSGASLFDTKSKDTKNRIVQLEAMIEAYRTRLGEYPSDRLPRGAAADATNANAEALFVALYSEDYGGRRPDEDWLVNTDYDVSSKQITSLGTRDLFEVGDGWGNPIVYLHNLHYERGATVMAGPEEDHQEQEVQAGISSKTEQFLKPSAFQLISAGEDGIFGNEDDLTNS